MKTRRYKNGKSTCKAFTRKVGLSYEVGMTYGNTTIFLGNFVHSAEANRFYAEMNKEIRRLSKKYKVGPNYPTTWFKNLISSHIYKKYYTFITKQLPKHNATCTRVARTTERKYKQLAKKWKPSTKKPSLRAA